MMAVCSNKVPPVAVEEKISIPKLMDICREGQFTRVREHFCAFPKDFHVQDDAGRLPLHWAASGGNLELVRFLAEILDENESIDMEDDMGWTPLIIASSAGHKNVVRFLQDAGADPNHSTVNGQISLHYAASKEHLEIALMLIEKGVNVNAQDKLGSTPLHRAASKGNTKMVHILLSQPKCNVNLSDKQKNTPLHLACEEKRTEVAMNLVKRGAYLDTQNEDENTPLELAESGLRNTLLRLSGTG